MTKLNLGGDEKKRNERMKRIQMKQWIGNQIGDEGAKTISESFKINSSLTELNLDGDERIWNVKNYYTIMYKCADNKVSKEVKQLLGIWK